jgi:threonine/homoserine/homoserine lactone efflux protein
MMIGHFVGTAQDLRHLILAYTATWIIHIAYLSFLAAKALRLKQEERELENTNDSTVR